MPDLMITTLFALVMGFVAAGICSSGYSLVTDARLGFDVSSGGTAVRVMRGILLVIAGPLVILRNAWRAAVKGIRPPGWLVATALLASMWSFCLGVAVINILVMIDAGVG